MDNEIEAVSWIWKSANDRDFPITIDRCRQADDSFKYAIRKTSSCMNKKGEWEYEPIPSSRDEDFYARCRFESLEEACKLLKSVFS